VQKKRLKQNPADKSDFSHFILHWVVIVSSQFHKQKEISQMAIKKKAAKAPAKSTARKATKARASVKKASKPSSRLAAIKKVAAAGNINLPTAPITEKLSKAQIFTELATITGMPKGEVKNLFTALRNVVERNLKAKGHGEFVIPEIGIKVRRIQKGATKARMGRNPFTGEEIKIAAKPARKSVKATAMKALKEIVMG
jgi:nucleoid DNA-binding protein